MYCILTVTCRYGTDRNELLSDAHIIPVNNNSTHVVSACPVCLTPVSDTPLYGIGCGHMFCTECWTDYVTSKIYNGTSTSLECMQCPVKVTMETIQSFIQTTTPLYARYKVHIITI